MTTLDINILIKEIKNILYSNNYQITFNNYKYGNIPIINIYKDNINYNTIFFKNIIKCLQFYVEGTITSQCVKPKNLRVTTDILEQKNTSTQSWVFI
mgnify:CR=1 FL=1